jgi:hypothetical protein
MGYKLEPRAADTSFQNGIAEFPNRTQADIMRSLLRSTKLGPEYWSWAIIHAVYLKNGLPHRATSGVQGTMLKCKVDKTFRLPYCGQAPWQATSKAGHSCNEWDILRFYG